MFRSRDYEVYSELISYRRIFFFSQMAGCFLTEYAALISFFATFKKKSQQQCFANCYFLNITK